MNVARKYATESPELYLITPLLRDNPFALQLGVANPSFGCLSYPSPKGLTLAVYQSSAKVALEWTRYLVKNSCLTLRTDDFLGCRTSG